MVNEVNGTAGRLSFDMHALEATSFVQLTQVRQPAQQSHQYCVAIVVEFVEEVEVLLYHIGQVAASGEV